MPVGTVRRTHAGLSVSKATIAVESYVVQIDIGSAIVSQNEITDRVCALDWVFVAIKGLENQGYLNQCVRICRIIEHMIDYEEWNADTPFLGKAESFMANNFVADVAARGMIKAAKAERESREAVAAGVPPVVESNFGLDFSIWDPLGWPVDLQDGDDLLFLGGNIGASS
ncbi:hypothetical protein BDV30DRAFT_239128 [Aspergillus minisclerotigenes]|uniref:Uncharacterized protein n=1 Tax=Aspergillus minisclerotigenes TaxID=656917 RepID=A0A5N6J1Z9_9EURO|nr:hypothetical protein BDV30DRAFT_239128 [Aspergillus minisclerotigenes]